MSKQADEDSLKACTREDSGKPNHFYSKSLTQALELLQCFTPEKPALRIKDIASILESDHATVRRYAVNLTALGFLERANPREYRLSLHVTSLGMSTMSSTPLEQHCQPSVESLCERIGCTVSVALLNGPDIIYTARTQVAEHGQSHLTESLRPGSSLPAHCTAIGKVLLASLHEADRHKLIGEMTLPHWGPNTITDKRIMTDELMHARRNGFATNVEELIADRIAVAVPIRDDSGEVTAAISMATSTLLISIEALIEKYLSYLTGTAAEISERLGFRVV